MLRSEQEDHEETHLNPSTPSRRRAIATIAGGLLLGPSLVRSAFAADWPAGSTIKIEIPFAAGGATDLVGRALAVELQKNLHQTVVVEDKPGAGGTIAAVYVANTQPDGYTLMIPSGSMFTVNPFIYQNLPYTLEKFSIVCNVASGPMIVVINASQPFKTTKELIAYAKANPGKLKFSSAGVGSQTHIAGEAFGDAAGIEIVHVPYKGELPGYNDLMAGVIDMSVGNFNAIYPLLKGGRLRALSVTSSERSTLLPDIPTTSEDGLPGFEFTGWFALMAPAGTPKPIIDRLFRETKAAVEQPGMKAYLAQQGMVATVTPPDELKAQIQDEAKRWKALIEKKHISAN
jgi:tripartite-type tricarboxylate transporter receptor subunit TctC